MKNISKKELEALKALRALGGDKNIVETVIVYMQGILAGYRQARAEIEHKQTAISVAKS